MDKLIIAFIAVGALAWIYNLGRKSKKHKRQQIKNIQPGQAYSIKTILYGETKEYTITIKDVTQSEVKYTDSRFDGVFIIPRDDFIKRYIHNDNTSFEKRINHES